MIPYGLILRIVLPLLLLAAFGAWCWTGGRSSERKVWKAKEAAQIEAQLAASEQARAKEQSLQIKVEQANEARKLDNAKNARIAARLKSDADGLRDQIASFAGGPAEDSSASCRDRSETLGALLGESLQVAAEGAADAEHCESNVRALLAAWPR